MGQLLDLVRELNLDQPQAWVPDLGPVQPDTLPEAPIDIATSLSTGKPAPDEETAFQQWYQPWAARYGMDPNPDSPQQHYDYRAAFKAGVQPPNVERGEHWPSDFKTAGHENLVVGGFHTQTGERVPGTPRASSVEELIQLGWEPETAQKLADTPEPPPTLKPDPGAREKPSVIPGPGSVIGSALGLIQAPYAAGAGALLDRPGDLGHAARAAWEAVKGVPATVYQPFGAQDIPTLGGELEKRGVPLSGGQTLALDVLGDPTNVVGGNPVVDLALLGKGALLGAPKLAAMGGMVATDAFLRSKRAAELAEAVASKFPRFAEALKTHGAGLKAERAVTAGRTVAQEVAGAVPPSRGIPLGVTVEEDAGHLLYAPAARSERGHVLVSTRLPTSVDRPVAEGGPLFTDLSVLQQAPKTMETIAGKLRRSPMLTAAEQALPARELIETFVERAKENLLRLWDDTPEAIREQSKLWYEGAHARMLEDATALGIEPEQSAALLAVLSPNNDWFVNAEVGRRVGYTWKQLKETDAVFTRDLFDRYREIQANTDATKLKAITTEERRLATEQLQQPDLNPATRKKLENRLKRYTPEELAETEYFLEAERQEEVAQWVGKKFSELPLDGKARMVRAFSDGLHPAHYNMIRPDGSIGALVKNADGLPTKLGWSVTYDMLEDAVSVLEDGSHANISQRLGGEHKVRSFYNNISDPWDPRSVTIDTHAVAAAHLMPFSGTATEVTDTMGAAAKHTGLGLSGSNAVYAEAYNRAAKARGVLPREMQSVTWESVRGLFSAEQKRDPAFIAYIRSLWDAHNTGKLSVGDVYEQIKSAAGQINPPDWATHVSATR